MKKNKSSSTRDFMIRVVALQQSSDTIEKLPNNDADHRRNLSAVNSIRSSAANDEHCDDQCDPPGVTTTTGLNNNLKGNRQSKNIITQYPTNYINNSSIDLNFSSTKFPTKVKTSLSSKRNHAYPWKLKLIDFCFLFFVVTILSVGLALRSPDESPSNASTQPSLHTDNVSPSALPVLRKLEMVFNISSPTGSVTPLEITHLRCKIVYIIDDPTVILSKVLLASYSQSASNGAVTVITVTSENNLNYGNDCGALNNQIRRVQVVNENSSTNNSTSSDFHPVGITITVYLPGSLTTLLLIDRLYSTFRTNSSTNNTGFIITMIMENNRVIPSAELRSVSPTVSRTRTNSITKTSTSSSSITPSSSKSVTRTSRPSLSSIATATNMGTRSVTSSPTISETATGSDSVSSSATSTETLTSTPTNTPTPSSTGSDTSTSSVTSSITPSSTVTPTRSMSSSPTSTPPTLAGVTWIPRASSRNWCSIASSADGNNLVAVAQNGFIYTSVNAGQNWTQRESSRAWGSVSSSADGYNLAAAVTNGFIYTSTNAGITWTQRESSRRWYGIASSSDGKYIIGCVYGGQLYVSADYGLLWTARETNRQWYAVAASANGTKLFAVVDQGYIYTSYDAGTTWVARDSSRQWMAITSSADGTRLAAVVPNGNLYTSSDSGLTWTSRKYADWHSVASSSDGSIILAGTYMQTLWVSTDYGLTMTSREKNLYWGSVATSADGTRFAVAVYGGQIYTSVGSNAPTTSPTTTPSGTATGTVSGL